MIVERRRMVRLQSIGLQLCCPLLLPYFVQISSHKLLHWLTQVSHHQFLQLLYISLDNKINVYTTVRNYVQDLPLYQVMKFLPLGVITTVFAGSILELTAVVVGFFTLGVEAKEKNKKCLINKI